jgi:hypothetical protein
VICKDSDDGVGIIHEILFLDKVSTRHDLHQRQQGELEPPRNNNWLQYEYPIAVRPGRAGSESTQDSILAERAATNSTGRGARFESHIA